MIEIGFGGPSEAPQDGQLDSIHSDPLTGSEPGYTQGSPVMSVSDAIVLRPGDERYPALLGAIDSPPRLEVMGSLEPADALAVAIVGSRRPTPYGVEVAEALAQLPRSPTANRPARTVGAS